MADPTATVLIPTHSHGTLIRFAIESVLRQTVQDFEIFVVGDGITEEGRSCVKSYAVRDPRVKFFDFPKGERHGELHRHAVLQNEARSDFVTYLSDDDLFSPKHLESIAAHIHEYNFIHPLGVCASTALPIWVFPTFLGCWEIRNRMSQGDSYVPLSGTSHTLELYRKLPFGWRTTPKEMPTDLYMWQQILAHPDCKPFSTFRPTMVHFPSPERSDWTFAQREQELVTWSERMAVVVPDSWIGEEVIGYLARLHALDTERLKEMETRNEPKVPGTLHEER